VPSKLNQIYNENDESLVGENDHVDTKNLSFHIEAPKEGKEEVALRTPDVHYKTIDAKPNEPIERSTFEPPHEAQEATNASQVTLENYKTKQGRSRLDHQPVVMITSQ